MKYVKTLYNHKLATQPLRDLLEMVGPAKTPEEQHILASLVGSYKRMRAGSPSKQLRNDVDALYTKAFLRVSNTVSALSALVSDYGWLAIKSKEPSTQPSKQDILGAVYEASDEVKPDIAPVLMRCHQLVFLALAAAANRIDAALKAAKKK
ncbi:MAG: hypothetical protein WAL52_06865 [Candidatus Sulfotelmatobacter sp.]